MSRSKNIKGMFPGYAAAAAAAVLLSCAFLPAAVYAADEGETGREGQATQEMDAREVAVNEKGTLTVGYVMIGAESDWRLACNRSVQEAFSRENGYSLLINDAQQKPEKQIKAVREFINQEVDYILLNPIVETGWDASLEEAREAGIPVIMFDREADVKEQGAFETWIGSDFYLEGEKACAWLETFLEGTDEKDESAVDREIGVVHIQGTINSSAQIGRTRALDEALERHPEWMLLDRRSGDFTTAKGKEVMVDMISMYGDEIDVVYCENDNEAYGAIDALREAGYTAGTDMENGEVLVISFDATHNGLSMTMEGQIAVNIECAPEYGPLLTQLIQKIEKHEALPFRDYVSESQFSSLEEPAEITVRGKTYPVTVVTEEVIGSRNY